MDTHLKVAGYLLLLLSFIHVVFPKYFKWAQEFNAVSLINRQMMYVHTFFIALVIFLTGILCLTSAEELLTTELGKRVALGFGIFWLFRLVIQFLGYSSTLWRGKRFETFVHILFSMLWTYLSLLFLLIYLL